MKNLLKKLRAYVEKRECALAKRRCDRIVKDVAMLTAEIEEQIAEGEAYYEKMQNQGYVESEWS